MYVGGDTDGDGNVDQPDLGEFLAAMADPIGHQQQYLEKPERCDLSDDATRDEAGLGIFVMPLALAPRGSGRLPRQTIGLEFARDLASLVCRCSGDQRLSNRVASAPRTEPWPFGSEWRMRCEKCLCFPPRDISRTVAFPLIG